MSMSMRLDTEELKKPNIVLYHADCLDGFGAAYAAWVHLKDTAVYIPVKYGEECPLIVAESLNKTIYILDFCYSKQELTEIASNCKKLVVVDHHEKSIEMFEAWDFNTWPDNLKAKYNLNKSGAVLTWEYFGNGIQGKCIPELLSHIQDRDLWRFRLYDTKAICEAFFYEARNFETWYQLDINWNIVRSQLVARGDLLLRVKDQTLTRLVENRYPCELSWYPSNNVKEVLNGIAVNAPIEFASDLANKLLCPPYEACDFVAVWSYLGDGEYKVSLRSSAPNGVNVNKIAICYGGGGHKHAAGFTCYAVRGILIDISKENKERSKDE